MAKTKQNLKQTQDFVRKLLAKNFNQKVDPEKLRAAAEKLRGTIPERPAKAA